MVKDKPYYKKINAADTINNIVKSCMDVVTPLLFVSFD